MQFYIIMHGICESRLFLTIELFGNTKRVQIYHRYNST